MIMIGFQDHNHHHPTDANPPGLSILSINLFLGPSHVHEEEEEEGKP